jgi:hypothetical protein
MAFAVTWDENSASRVILKKYILKDADRVEVLGCD